MPVPYDLDGMLHLAATATTDTPHTDLVTLAKGLAKAVHEQRNAILAHRGVIIAIADQDGDDMVHRLDEAWPL
ncbi:MAG: hypothetical protein L0H84_14220 [Pseudonocardia sp.]|nr:hypothetical protein [Pseudonocardia sp.]